MSDNNNIENFTREYLRRIDERLERFESDMRDLKDGQIAIRDDIHAVRGDIRRNERSFAAMENDIDRIKTRLDLSD